MFLLCCKPFSTWLCFETMHQRPDFSWCPWPNRLKYPWEIRRLDLGGKPVCYGAGVTAAVLEILKQVADDIHSKISRIRKVRGFFTVRLVVEEGILSRFTWNRWH